jgi:DNA-binding transcriptional LysR family regulator
LQSSRFVTYEPTRGFNFHADLYALCRLAGFTPDVAHEAPTTEAVVGIVACGEGVAIIPSSAERLRMRGVAFRPLVTAHKQRQLGQVSFALAWRKGQTSATVQKFLEIARTPASSLAND